MIDAPDMLHHPSGIVGGPFFLSGLLPRRVIAANGLVPDFCFPVCVLENPRPDTHIEYGVQGPPGIDQFFPMIAPVDLHDADIDGCDAVAQIKSQPLVAGLPGCIAARNAGDVQCPWPGSDPAGFELQAAFRQRHAVQDGGWNSCIDGDFMIGGWNRLGLQRAG